MIEFTIRSSALANIMADPASIDPELLNDETAAIKKKKVKTDEDKAILAPLLEQSLSAGAKTFIEASAKELIYGYENIVTGKYMEKGIQVEDQSIDLYNLVNFTDHKKNTERKTTEWVTGECDIFTHEKIIDIKSSWSLQTFPALSRQGEDSTYEWQGRAYMMLWDVPAFEVAYCLVDTPEELIGYEDPALHSVSHINPALRVTTVQYLRDLALENRIKVKVTAARKYFQTIVQQIAAEHT